MAGTSNTAGIPASLAEGHSITRPPLFNGSNYSFWKVRMRNFIQSVDIEAWQRIVKGPEIPLKLHADGYRGKVEDEYNELDWKKVSLNAKALNILHCALDATEYNRISGCTSAKEVWDKLEVTYEGTNQVKESKANRLVREYELFEMKPGETISLEKEFTEEELVKKVLRSLPKSWETKVTVIFDTKDFSKFTYDELIGSLIAHEMLYDKSKSNVDDEKKKRGIALKSSQDDELRKTIAFKAASSDSSNSSSEEDDLAMITRRFKKAFKKGGSRYKKFLKKYSPKGETSKDQSEIKCFECNKPGHIKLNCHKLKRKNSKDKSKKALVAGWMDSDDSSSDNSSDKEVAHICLIALEEDKLESSQQREINTEVNNSDSLSIEDYEEAFAKLYEEYKVYKKKSSALNKEIASLRAENDSMSIIVQENKFYKNQMLLFDELNKELEDSKIACEKLIEKNRILETMVKSLTNDLAKFTNGTQILDTLLGSQRLSNQKSGLGYDGFMHYGKYKNFFVCLRSKQECEQWYVDSACSRHMTGDKEKFSNLTLKSGGHVRFGDKGKAYIIESGSIGKNPSIKDVALVEGLKFNLLSKDNLKKFDVKSDEGILLGYSMHSKAYRVFNRRTLLVEETIHVIFDETNNFLERKIVCDDDELGKIFGRKKDETQKQQSQPIEPQSTIVNDVDNKDANEKDQEAQSDESWIIAMQEELNQFERNKVWKLVPRPRNHSIIGTKWVFRNKMDDKRHVIRNKARLVAQ
ncbi:spindle assembly checkpoint component MAD1-like [Hevea brasiliensis]|uniref:spindle assembly checkpoint component MAD1-like n=1 Tax=Hevea brasiliensis TaxID=3981 RepID=UPI0025F03DD4|nr:spindle assembly checkpoint component MAD1-like [Hevea brasiliensis]